MQNTLLCVCLKRATFKFMLVFNITAVVPWTPTAIIFSAWFPGSNSVSNFLRQWVGIAGIDNKLYITYQRSQ